MRARVSVEPGSQSAPTSARNLLLGGLVMSIYRDYIVIMEKKMETTIVFRV